MGSSIRAEKIYFSECAEPVQDTPDIALVKIPVQCPQCGTEQLCDYPEPVVLVALTRWNNMNLHAPCHDVYWSASRSELRAIREYLSEDWIEARLSALPA